ncbi:MAG TPA: toll/interleukin-1 receptor domain-containing protein, partial [Rhodocyclaceae bacterium]|nr:toll/interleukin-1 receptor domain-containing protein [Rhodocyclaceae bacterium]
CDPLRVCICAESDAETFLLPIERQLAGTLAEAARLSGSTQPPALRVSIVTLAGLHAAGAALSRADITLLAVEADRARLESLCEHLNRNLDPPPFHRAAAWVNGPRDGAVPPTVQGWNVVGFRVAGGNATAQHESDAGRLRDLMQAVLRQRSGAPRSAAEPAGAPRSPAVFLSYCSEYRPYANAIASALWRLGVTVHWDGGLAPGDAWEERLAQMLRESDAVLALVGRLTAGRANPMHEIRTALSLGRKLLPVWVEPIDGPPEVLRFQFANRSGNGGTVFLAGLTGRRLEDEAVAIADRIAAALSGRQAPPDLSSAPTAGSTAGAPADEILARIAGKLSGEAGPDRQSTGHFLEIREGLQADLAALIGLDVGDSDGSTWPHRFTLETTSGLWIGLARQVQEGDGRAPRYRDCLLLHRVAAVVDGARLVESWSPDPALRDPVLAFGVIVAEAGEVPLGELPGSGTQAA